ncbi:MAG: CoB--CoM heterodisulfide reductase iron-sulfur subunit B family protein [Proteobacteria bacterium]|nr:CoB--CoM heterodisulfide reductase iron-sulfur subunit B family protein [Pseudomonadota bacterium]MBU4470616.1 CoB--CoM heterodisulfide reductase iron-sulfur subunit B family protein [Pseudomonadota bacterium]MCG2753341.1 CoB--CoM heterodisulfide reductase iron-sulfur subunit B family protein [Desulfobacteraceae bacterium]
MKYGFFPGCAYKTAAGYETSVNAVNRLLGIELVEIRDWNCCGATAAFSREENSALALAARIMALADQQGFSEIITVCNACYATLKKAEHKLCGSARRLKEVNGILKTDGLSLNQPIPVRHYLDLLIEDIPLETWPKEKNKVFPSHGRVAAYYGCQLTRPYGDASQAERPDRLENLLSALGVPVVSHSAKTLCCGASHIIGYEKQCLALISRITGEMKNKGAEIITTLCPMCQFNLDYGQEKIQGKQLPVTYFTQVIGLAMGIAPESLGLDKLLVPLILKRSPQHAI